MNRLNSNTVVSPLLNTHQHFLQKISQLLPLVAALFIPFVVMHLGVAELSLAAYLRWGQVDKQLFSQLNFRLQRLISDY